MRDAHAAPALVPTAAHRDLARAARSRQTWVDDQGSYIALTGGLEHGVMTDDDRLRAR